MRDDAAGVEVSVAPLYPFPAGLDIGAGAGGRKPGDPTFLPFSLCIIGTGLRAVPALAACAAYAGAWTLSWS